MNYKGLAREDKEILKPLVAELRKQLYTTDSLPTGSDEPLVMNFGKGEEPRKTVTITVIE